MNDTPPSRVEITIAEPRLSRTGSSLELRSLAAARTLVSLPRRALSVVFPRQGPPPLVPILPGFAAQLDIRIKAPGLQKIHLYPDSETVLGETRLRLGPPRSLDLDLNGHGSTVVEVTPEDHRTTGQAAFRIVAVDPNTPDEVAGTASGVILSQEGTGQLARNLLALLIIFGLSLQVWAGDRPVLAAMIALALGFTLRNAPMITGVRFEPRRLLRPAAMLRAAGLFTLGVLIWAGAMAVNIWSETAADACGTAFAAPCDDWPYVIFDNATSIAASLGFAFLALAAWAPAIRPAYLVGQLALFAGLLPLFFYDLTLIPTGFDGAAAESYRPATDSLLAGYPAIGWSLAGFGIGIVMVRNRLGTVRQRIVPFAIGLIGLLVMVVFSRLLHVLPLQETFSLNEFVTRRLFGLTLLGLAVWLLVRPLLIPIGRQRQWRRWLIGSAALTVWLGLLGWGVFGFMRLSDALGPPNVTGVDFILFAVVLQLGLIGAALTEGLLWRRRRKRGGAPAAASDPDIPESNGPPAVGTG
jgi:hypothetical protein